MLPPGTPEAVLESKLLSENLKTRHINLEEQVNKIKFKIKIDKEAYKRYKFDFLTSKKTAKKRVFEIWKEILFKNNYRIK